MRRQGKDIDATPDDGGDVIPVHRIETQRNGKLYTCYIPDNDNDNDVKSPPTFFQWVGGESADKGGSILAAGP